MPQYEVHFHSNRNYLNYLKAPPTQFISNHLMLLDSIITLQSWTRTSAFREIMFSILVQEVETKRSYSFILLVNTSSYSSMLLPESSFFLLTFGTNLSKLQSKGFILAKLKIDTIFRKNPTFIFPHPGQLQDPLHVINDLSMYFRLNHSGRILWFNCLPEPQIFLNASYSCVTDCHSKNIFFTPCRAVYLHQCGMDLSVNHLWHQFKAIFTFTTAFHTSSFKQTQQQKKHWVATSCPSGTDLAGHKCLWGTWSRVWLQETQIVPKLHRAQLMLTRISTKWVHSVQATAAH